MQRRAGFTLIELLIAITIMVILLTLAVVNLRSSQANARDEERKTDITSIAQQLESFYQTGTTTSGVYPATNQMNTEALVTATLSDLNPKALRDPLTADASPISLIVATDANTPTLASLNSGKTYIYQPLDSSNALCTSSGQECRKFNLYYTLETNASVINIASKHQ